MHRQLTCLVVGLLCLLPLSARSGEVLYNGIELPGVWPPRRTAAELKAGEPMRAPYLEQPPAVIPIDVGRQLFVDDFLIEHTTLTRRFHRCEMYAQNPVLRPDRRWEMIFPTKTAMAFSDGCFFDPRDKQFKLWYMAALFGDTAYAVSQDGLKWTKPALDVRPPTNIVLLGGQRDSAAVWLDHDAADPAQRFKLFQFNRDNWRGSVHASPDGIHWTEPRWTGPAGDRSTFFYNPFRKVWVFSIRAEANKGPWQYQQPPYNQIHRARKYWESRDFLAGASWTGGNLHEDWQQHEPGFWVASDRLDSPDGSCPFSPTGERGLRVTAPVGVRVCSDRAGGHDGGDAQSRTGAVETRGETPESGLRRPHAIRVRARGTGENGPLRSSLKTVRLAPATKN